MTATATAERSKLELLRAKEAELTIAVDEARERIARYPEQLHEARSRAIYAKPNVRPGAELNSEVSKLNAKEKKDLDGLRALEADLSACRGVLAIEAQRVTEEATAEARAQLAKFHDQEEAVWKRGSELFASLADVWNELVEIIETEDHSSRRTSSRVLAFSQSSLRRLRSRRSYCCGGATYDSRVVGTRTIEIRRRLDARDCLLASCRTCVALCGL